MEIDLPGAAGDPAGRGRLSEALGAQVCVIGGGIAGLVLAHRLAQDGLRVTLLEAGTRDDAAAGSDPFEAELAGVPHLGTRDGRIRGLGGCSRTWGGQLLPLPEDAGWAVRRDELAPYEEAARRLLGGSALPFEAEAFFASIKRPAPALLSELPGVQPRVSQFLPFSRRDLERILGRVLRRHPRVQVVLGAPVQRLLLSADGRRVAAVVLGGTEGEEIGVRAEQYVVAAGTVESCRLLLASSITADGQVGRRFHDHLTMSLAEFTGGSRRRVLAELGPWVSSAPGAGTVVHSVKLEPGAALRAELGLLPAMAHLTVEEPEGSGVGAVRELLRARQQKRWSWRQAMQLPGALWQGLRLLWTAKVRRRRYVSAAAKVRLQVNVAQVAGAGSWVELGDGVDRGGVRRARVVWHVHQDELATIRRVAAYMRARLEAAGCGEGAVWVPALFTTGAESDAALIAVLDDARHAMGGVCLGTDPRTSVVDPELRVHGVDNLSVASAAVFPDGSAQLPTLTLAALCLRLAERLGRGRGGAKPLDSERCQLSIENSVCCLPWCRR